MTRDELFNHLHETHAHKWMNSPRPKPHARFHAWRMEWWKELERAFPDKIKNGTVIRGQNANS